MEMHGKTLVYTHTHTIIIVGIVFSITKPTSCIVMGKLVIKTLLQYNYTVYKCVLYSNPEQAHIHSRDCVSNLNIQVGTDLCLCHWSQARFPH